MALVTLLTAGVTLTGCATLDTINNDPTYQTTKQVISSWTQYVGEKTTDFINSNATTKKRKEQAEKYWKEIMSGVKAEADILIEEWKQTVKKEVDKMKENIKQEIKNKVNKEIDESFDKI